MSNVFRRIFAERNLHRLWRRIPELGTAEQECRDQARKAAIALAEKAVALGITTDDDEIEEYIQAERNPKKRAAAQEILLAENWLYDERRALMLLPNVEDVHASCIQWKAYAQKDKTPRKTLRDIAMAAASMYEDVDWKIEELKSELEMLIDLCIILADPHWNPTQCLLSRTLRSYENE